MLTARPVAYTDPLHRFPVRIAPEGNAPGTRYDVDGRYGPLRFSPYWQRWLTRDTAVTRVIGTPAVPPTVGETSFGTGRTDHFRGLARDGFGNATAPVYSAGAVVPHDDHELVVSGSVARAVARTASYGGRATLLRAAGATAQLKVAGDVIQVIGERCPTCGEVDVFLDGVRQARVDTRAPARVTTQVLWSRRFTSAPRRMVTLRAVGTPGRPYVVLDGIGAREWTPVPDTSLGTFDRLRAGQRLVSVDGRSQALLAPGGALVVSTDGRTSFAIGTRGAARLDVQLDGNLVLYDAARTPLWQSRSRAYGSSYLVMQSDGNLVLYGNDPFDAPGPLWSSRGGPVLPPGIPPVP